MSITMNQRTFKVELFQGDDLDRLAELSTSARALKPIGQSTSIEDGEYVAAAEEHDSFLDDAKTRAVHLEMKPLPRKAYQTLLVQHPPREDDPGDAALGANAATIAEPLLLGCLSAPFDDAERNAFVEALSAGAALPTCPDRQGFLDSLNFAQFTHLTDEALAINRVVFAPKAPLLGSAPSPNSGETSGSPETTSD